MAVDVCMGSISVSWCHGCTAQAALDLQDQNPCEHCDTLYHILCGMDTYCDKAAEESPGLLHMPKYLSSLTLLAPL